MRRLTFAIAAVLACASVQAAPTRIPEQALARAVELREQALADDTGWKVVESLTTEVGPRLAGSEADARAVEWAKAKFRALGFDRVWTEPVTFPKWERRSEQAQVLGAHAQPLAITALGGSPAGTAEGEVVRFDSLDALKAAPAGSLAGKIAFIDYQMTRSRSGEDYGIGGTVRSRGPSEAIRKGALGYIMRSAGTDSHRVPHTGMRRAIARRLTESKQNVPHFYLTVDCRMDALLALRAQANQGGAVKLSVNDFIVRAAALALREVPEVNASWHEDAVEYHAGADISVAVATDGGLVTPILRDADVKPLSAIAGEISELAGRAKINRLKPEEFTGGSLTVSNLGMYGISQFAAIINPPQAAILAVGAAERRPVVDENGALVAASVMTVTLSADHRVVDGAVGARWLAAFRTLIENPVRILL